MFEDYDSYLAWAERTEYCSEHLRECDECGWSFSTNREEQTTCPECNRDRYVKFLTDQK